MPASSTLNGDARLAAARLAQVKLAQLVQDRLVPVFVDNDVNTLAVSERLYGRGHDVENFLTVTIGRGVGLGIVTGGDIYRGFGGGAGEFGHIPPSTTAALHMRQARLPGDRRRRPGVVAEARRQGCSRAAGIERLRELAEAGMLGTTDL